MFSSVFMSKVFQIFTSACLRGAGSASFPWLTNQFHIWGLIKTHEFPDLGDKHPLRLIKTSYFVHQGAASWHIPILSPIQMDFFPAQYSAAESMVADGRRSFRQRQTPHRLQRSGGLGDTVLQEIWQMKSSAGCLVNIRLIMTYTSISYSTT